MLGERGADQEQYQKMIERLHLDKPVLLQYFEFTKASLSADFGVSIVSHQSVLKELLTRWPATIELGILALLIAVVIGIPAGVIAAIKRNTAVDYLVMTGSVIGYSMPIFWWGLILIIFFSINLDLTPVSGRLDLIYDVEPVTGFMLIDTLMPSARKDYGFAAFYSVLAHLILPALTMATIPLAVFARMTRSSMLEVLSEDYIRTAKAKGLSFMRIIWFHAFRNVLTTVITIGGILFVSTVITGAILTETIFGWPGIGSYIVSSVYARDYPVIQASIILIGLFVVITNIVIDLLYRQVNPRLRIQTC
jgi:dipeptide transport system permease protein